MKFNNTLGDNDNVTTMVDLLGRLAGISGGDESTGNSAWGDGWCARFGKRLFYSSEFTGDRVEKYDTVEQAQESFNEYDHEWIGDDDDDCLI